MTGTNLEIGKATGDAVVEFFRNILPFNELDDQTLIDLVRHCRVAFQPKGTRLLSANKSEVPCLMLIQQGAVQCFITDEEGEVTLKDYRGEGAYVGALAIIRGTLANLDVETVEDSFLLLLPRDVFLELINTQEGLCPVLPEEFFREDCQFGVQRIAATSHEPPQQR